ncbi:Peroxisomal biogenesis factor 2 [Grifola frondosa]|uniref:RING-type E3 ubiquitin transferase (cysteine targeting) n=1 Tax=Grifola frondosa TaxID=5627 RepID=A0A1C7MGZ9_GRIFR|nr:Peroxisomal biogenesis factor 2 [Grifola frondosa]
MSISSPSPRIVRVGQVDAELLDQELVQLLKEPLIKALGIANSALKAKFEPELTLLIHLILYKFSLVVLSVELGALLQLLFPISTHKISAHMLYRTLGQMHRHRTGDVRLGKFLTTLEATHSLFWFSQLCRLSMGRYRTVADRLLGMRLVSARKLAKREVSYEFMNRQMVWHAFTVRIPALLTPPINIRALRRRITFLTSQLTLSNILPKPVRSFVGISERKSDDKVQVRRGKYWALSEDQCAICAENASTNLNLADPSNALTSLSAMSIYTPSHTSASNTTGDVPNANDEPPTYPIHTPYITSCGHVYCYYCLSERMMRTTDERSGLGANGAHWECLRCTEAVTGADRLEAEVAGPQYESGDDLEFEYGSEDVEFTDMSGSIGINVSVAFSKCPPQTRIVYVVTRLLISNHHDPRHLRDFLWLSNILSSRRSIMNTQVNDYLTKQLLIEKNVVSKTILHFETTLCGTQDKTRWKVTFRSLSRQFNIHVNIAKNELATFHNNSPSPCFATYLVSGEVTPTPTPRGSGESTQDENSMDVDTDATDYDAEMEENDEPVPVTKVTLVGQNDLDKVKSQYSRIFSQHNIQLISVSLDRLICGPSEIVHKVDVKISSSASTLLGRIVGADVHVGKPIPAVASSSKLKEAVARKPTLKVKEKERESPAEESQSRPKVEKVAAMKSKASSKLDWSKAKKPKEESNGQDSEEKPPKMKTKNSPVPAPKAVKKELKEEKASKTESGDSSKREVKRGTKRKSALPTMSDSEDDDKTSHVASTPTMKETKVKKGVILSDEEEDTSRPALRRDRAKAKGKSKAKALSSDSEAERSLKAMMDIDDDQVVRASCPETVIQPEDIANLKVEDEDAEMADEQQPVLKAKSRKKKEKKVIPVGRNGLKKKRVQKTRMTMDAKGYMVTEDYSSYESVDEESSPELDVPKKTKRGTRSKKIANATSETKVNPESKEMSEEETTSNMPAGRSSGAKPKKGGAGSSKAGGQGNITSFFGKNK